MSQDGFLVVVNWTEFQHYKDRAPPWIKLHTALLEKYEYQRLQDASKAHLVGIWMLASRLENRIPNDPEWIATRIGAQSIIDFQALEAAGFISYEGRRASKPLALGLQSACLETEGEGESERETKKTGADAPFELPDDEDEKEEPLGAFYGRVLKNLLWPALHQDAQMQRKLESRDISILKNQLAKMPRPDIEDAVRGVRSAAEAGQINCIPAGTGFGLRYLVADTEGIAMFDKYRHAAVKRRECEAA